MVVKRGFDVVVSLCALIVLGPLMLLVALLVALDMGWPVLFRQQRPGLHGRLFTLYKFRTMRDAMGPDGCPLPDSERLTALGRVLRATSVDELPELLNVLKGEMSLVGPRPLLARYLPHYTEREQTRHRVRPGITGWAQILGRNQARWDQRLACDVWYVENWSLRLDLLILARTVMVVFRRSGVVVDPESAMLSLDEERIASARGDGASEPGREPV